MKRSPMATKPPRPKPCAACKERFTPTRPLQAVCPPPKDCAQVHARKLREKKAEADRKKERKEDREKRENTKSRADLVKEAQTAFNAWVKLRDADKPCISCGRHHQGAYHAGHFLSVGARPNLRFAEANVHKQCAPCNMHLHGNLINYRMGLTERIGVEGVELLEADHLPRHYSPDDLRAIKADYSARARALKRQ